MPAAGWAPTAINRVAAGEESGDLVDHTAVAVLAHRWSPTSHPLVSFPYLASDQVVFPTVKVGLVAGERRGHVS
jgi:hypothetical protein